MTTAAHAATIRAEYKAKGWTSRDISVTSSSYSMGSSITVRIKNPAVPLAAAEAIANGHESIRRCEYSGEILSGGNRYVSVGYSHEAATAIEAQYADVLNAAAAAIEADPSDRSLHPVGDTGFLLGRGSQGSGFSLWQDSHIALAHRAIDLAVTLHARRTR